MIRNRQRNLKSLINNLLKYHFFRQKTNHPLKLLNKKQLNQDKKDIICKMTESHFQTDKK